MLNKSQLCIWYVSKYVSPPGNSSAGSRGYMIMKELSKSGHACVIITSDSNMLGEVPNFQSAYHYQKDDHLHITWIKTFKYSSAKSLRRIMSWLDFEWRLLWMPESKISPPNVVVVSSLSLLTILNGFRLRRKYGCKLFFEVRDIWPLSIVEEGGFSEKNPLVTMLSFIERWGYKYSDGIIGTMPNLKEHVSDVLGYEKKVSCVPMGLDFEVYSNAIDVNDDYIKRYLSSGKFTIVHAGTIGITNALDTFFKCAELLAKRNDIQFLVVGEGGLKDKYKAQYAHLENLIFAPRVPKSMVQSVLSKCDLLYFSTYPSKVWKYGQSLNKIIDYMVAGKPIVASYSGFPSMINEANCGSYVPAGDVYALRDEILRYQNLPISERQILGARGREWIFKNRLYSNLAEDFLKAITTPTIIKECK